MTKVHPAQLLEDKRKVVDEEAPVTKKAKLDEGSSDQEQSKTIFVGRLSWNVDNDWLASEFAECGSIVSARVQIDRNSGKSRGFGFVEFETVDGVNAAVALNGKKEIDGRAVNIDITSPKAPNQEKRAKAFGDTTGEPSLVLFVGNLSFNTTEDALWEVFSEYGEVKSVRLPTDRETQRPKGFGYVEFSDTASAKKALETVNGQDICGRPVRLDFSQPRGEGGGNGRGRGGFGGGFGGGGRVCLAFVIYFNVLTKLTQGGRGGFGDGSRVSVAISICLPIAYDFFYSFRAGEQVEEPAVVVEVGEALVEALAAEALLLSKVKE